MTLRYQFALAQTEDDAELCACLANNHMGTGISVSFRREPSYFNACQIQGDEYTIIKCTDSHCSKIVGVGACFQLNAFMNGQQHSVGYLADLRLDEEARCGSLLPRGYRYFKQLHNKNPLDFYYSLILSNNKHALQQLTSYRAGLPMYRSLGRILTPAIHLDLPKSAIRLPGLHFKTANTSCLPEVLSFIQKQYALKQFSPMYSIEHFHSGRLAGLKPEDIYLAYRGNHIVATLAVWDQSNFRQTYLERYSTLLNSTRPFYNLLSKLTPLKPLPQAGTCIPYVYFSMIAVENNDVSVFRALFRYVYRERRAGKWHYTIVGLHEQDPLAECLFDYRQINSSGELFEVYYPKIGLESKKLDDRIPYIEIACA